MCTFIVSNEGADIYLLITCVAVAPFFTLVAVSWAVILKVERWSA